MSEPVNEAPSGLLRVTLIAQAVYYFVFGLWPLVHMSSFLSLTGSKEDLWLVVTVGVVLAAVGAAIAVGAARVRPTLETAILSVGVAAVLAAVDIAYVSLGRIPGIYLADAAVEVVLVLGVVAGWLRAYRTARPAMLPRTGAPYAASETRR